MTQLHDDQLQEERLGTRIEWYCDVTGTTSRRFIPEVQIKVAGYDCSNGGMALACCSYVDASHETWGSSFRWSFIDVPPGRFLPASNTPWGRNAKQSHPSPAPVKMTPSDADTSSEYSPSPSLPPPGLTLPDLCDDVLLLICTQLSPCSPKETPLKNLALTNRRLHALVAPQLLKTLHINVPLKLLHVDSLRHFHAHTLKIDMFGSMWWWCSGVYVNGEDALELFRLIRRLGALRKLEVSMLARSTDIFRAAFTSAAGDWRQFTLPTIETLVVSSSAAFLVAHCPALKSLVIHDAGECIVETYTDAIAQLAPLHPQIRATTTPSLHLEHLDALALWSAGELLYLANTFPNLQSLNMRSIGSRYSEDIFIILSILSQKMPHLKTLKLYEIHRLDVGFQPFRKSSILATRVDEIRLDLLRINECRRVQAENMVARLAFTQIDGLREFWVGEQRVARRVSAEAAYGNKEEPKISWMWEREMDERDDSLALMYWAEMFWVERDAVVVRNELGT